MKRRRFKRAQHFCTQNEPNEWLPLTVAAVASGKWKVESGKSMPKWQQGVSGC